METLINCHELSKSFGSDPLFTNLSLSITNKDKIGIIGANGVGKSTLLKILAGREDADSGQVTRRRHLKVGYVPQISHFSQPEDSLLAAGLAALAQGGGNSPSDASRVAMSLAQAGFNDLNQKICELSGGWKKRLSVCCACLGDPDLVFFDEPTNHLDWEGQEWLLSFLEAAPFAWAVVSHDRYLLNTVTKSLVDIDAQYEQGLLCTQGSYDQHLEQKAAYVTARQGYRESLENKLRREEEWLARGAQARSTKAKYRSQAAEKLQQELQQTKNQLNQRRIGIEFVASGRQTKKLIECEKLSFSYGSESLLSQFTYTFTANRIVGLLGANGVGKTSLFKLITGELKAQSGCLTLADGLKIVYFDQQREQLNPQESLRQALASTGDQVIWRGSSLHVNSWAQRFGFKANRLDTPVAKLSGGEQARVLIARLMLQQADVLLLDEPTNDLDIASLEVLEESLRTFPGAVLLISHDRYMLQKLCDSYLGFCGKAQLRPFASVSQWLQQRIQEGAERKNKTQESAIKIAAGAMGGTNPAAGSKAAEPTTSPAGTKTKKLSYLEQREFDSMEAKIEAAETQLEELKLSAAELAQTGDRQTAERVYSDLQTAQEMLEQLYRRWAELETKLQSL